MADEVDGHAGGFSLSAYVHMDYVHVWRAVEGSAEMCGKRAVLLVVVAPRGFASAKLRAMEPSLLKPYQNVFRRGSSLSPCTPLAVVFWAVFPFSATK